MTPDDLWKALEATWPPEEIVDMGRVRLRKGQGGKRVSSTFFDQDDPSLILCALDLMVEHKGRQLFQVTEHQQKIDTKLADMGFSKIDPTLIYSKSLDAVGPIPDVTAFAVWPPLQIMKDIWQAGNIDQTRLDVMDRAPLPKTAILGRVQNRAAGVAFGAIHGKTAMLHALEVAVPFRRLGLARFLTLATMQWARDTGAMRFCLAVTERNEAARMLYGSLGMTVVGRYHYRMKP